MRVQTLINLLLSRMKPDRRVGDFGRMSSKPELFQTVLQGGRVLQVAWIRNRFDLQALDKSCPERNGNEPSAYQRGEGQDYYCRRDGDGLLPSAIASSWSQTAGTHHCHCFPRFLAQAKLSQQIADPWVGRSSGTDCGRPSLGMRLWRCAATNALRIATGRLSWVASAMSSSSAGSPMCFDNEQCHSQSSYIRRRSFHCGSSNSSSASVASANAPDSTRRMTLAFAVR